MSKKIWLLGDAVVDLIPDGSSYLRCPGGAPANVAVAIARLEGNAGFIGRVGKDPFGRFMCQTLESEGVDTKHLVQDEQHRTSTVVVDLDESGERSFTFMVKPSADQFYCEQDIPDFDKGEWLHTCSIALANQPSRAATLLTVDRMKEAGGYVCFDPNLREEVWTDPSEIRSVVMSLVKKADVVKFSEEELLWLTEESSLTTALEMVDSTSKQLLIVTLGSDGALFFNDGEIHCVASSPTEAIDTTGAGDAFVGGLLAKLSQTKRWKNKETIEEAIRWGNIVGSLTVTKKGAMTALPTKQQLIEYL